MKSFKLFFNVFLLVLVFRTLTAVDLQGVKVQYPNTPVKISQDVLTDMYNIALEKAKVNNPDLYNRLVSPVFAKTADVKSEVGDTETFTVLNIETNSFYDVPSTLRAKGTVSQVWVEDASWDAGYVNQTVVDDILDNLENKTAAGSIDSTKGIYYIDTENFGNPPNVDGDGLVDFLVVDIQDGYSGSGSYVAGFFYSGDQTGGNHRDMLYLDSYPGIYNGSTRSTDNVLGTTSHEFQHLIHYNYDTNEETWLNEAMSQLAATMCGYGLDNPAYFLANPNTNVTTWSGEYFDYTVVNMWSEYMYEQFGVDFITQLVQSNSNGTNSVDAVMTGLGISSSFDQSYQNWILCNYINDVTVDSRWGYTHPDAQGLRAAATSIYTYPSSESDVVEEYGALYYYYGIGEDLALTYGSTYGFAKLIRMGDSGTDVVDLPNGSEFVDGDFGTVYTHDVVVTGSLNNNASFTLDADATSDVLMAELAHDDGEADATASGYTHLGTGDNSTGYGWIVGYDASSYYHPKLNMIRLHASLGGSGDIMVHIATIDIRSGTYTDLVTPVTATVVDGWNDLKIEELFGAEIDLPDEFYVGFSHASSASAVYVGMDNSDPANYTYLIGPDGTITALHDLGTDYEEMNFMIRALISYSDPTAVAEGNFTAEKFTLAQNYPNPFNPTTDINYTVPLNGQVNISVYNILGQKIATLYNGYQTSGAHTVTWDGKNSAGMEVPGGVYFYRLTANGKTMTKKMMLLK